jgi:hypothetical protein
MIQAVESGRGVAAEEQHEKDMRFGNAEDRLDDSASCCSRSQDFLAVC